jgi:hypothetical protein
MGRNTQSSHAPLAAVDLKLLSGRRLKARRGPGRFPEGLPEWRDGPLHGAERDRPSQLPAQILPDEIGFPQ